MKLIVRILVMDSFLWWTIVFTKFEQQKFRFESTDWKNNREKWCIKKYQKNYFLN